MRPCVQRTIDREIASRREDDRKLKLLERRASDTGPMLELLRKAKQSAPPPSPVVREIARNSCTKPEAATRADKKAKPNRRAHWVNVAADEEQDTAALIAALEALFSRHIVLPENGAFVCALWTLHTWVFDAFASSPFLLIESPTKQCGKTTLLTLLSWLTRRAMLSSNISAAALYRYIEKHEPTLIVDEADTFMRENEALRGILNSGHTRAGAYVVRCIGEGTAQEPVDFSTWCPKAVASIGTMKDTIKDRGIRLTLTRRTRDQQIDRRPMSDTPEFIDVRSRLQRWAEDNEAWLRAYQVELPDELFNRLGDNWEPLLAIAGIAGDDIRKRAEKAAVSIAEAAEEGDRKVDLLEDIRRVFDNAELDEITAETLVVHLCDLPETPWEVWRPGDKPITSRGVSTMLKGFGLKSHHESHARVWRKTDFAKAWKAYLAPGGRE